MGRMPRVKSAGNDWYSWRKDKDDVEEAMLLMMRKIPLLFVGGAAMRCMKEAKREVHILGELLTFVMG